MPFRNPRIFSLHLAIWTGLGTLAAVFLAICLEFGQGHLIAGIPSASTYSLLLSPGLLLLALVTGLLAWLAGRFLGTTLASALVISLLTIPLVITAVKTRPAQRFRSLIWAEAPRSLEVIQYDMLNSFGDGTDYTFVISCDRQQMQALCQAAHLSQGMKPDTTALLAYFGEDTFPSDTEFYRHGHIEAAYAPSLQQAFILRLSDAKELSE